MSNLDAFDISLGQEPLIPSTNWNGSQGSFCQVVWRVLFTKMTHQSVAGPGNGTSARAHVHRKVLKKENPPHALLPATLRLKMVYMAFSENKNYP